MAKSHSKTKPSSPPTASSDKPEVFIKGPVFDMFNGMPIRYPKTDNTPLRFAFDCLFTKDGEWFYVNSVQSKDDPRRPNQWRAVEERKQYWALVDAQTGKVVSACEALYRDAKMLKLAMHS